MPKIVCSPHPGSFTIPDKMVKEYDMKIAIHSYGPEDKRFSLPYDVMKAVQDFDKKTGPGIDIG